MQHNIEMGLHWYKFLHFLRPRYIATKTSIQVLISKELWYRLYIYICNIYIAASLLIPVIEIFTPQGCWNQFLKCFHCSLQPSFSQSSSSILLWMQHLKMNLKLMQYQFLLTKFHEDILWFIKDNIVEIFTNYHLDRRRIPVFWDFFWHQMWL